MATKHPELEKLRDELLARQVDIEEGSAPLREERQKLREQITPALDRIRALDKEIHAAEQPQLRDIHRQLVGLVKAIRPKKEERETVTLTAADVGTVEAADILKE